MSTSFISHKSQDGSRAFAVLSLTVLRSVTPEQANVLHQIGIRSLSDLLHFDPIHRARLVEAVAQHRIAHDFDLRTILSDAAADHSPETLLGESTEVLDGIGAAIAVLLRNAFGVNTVAQLANFPPFVEAEVLMRNQIDSFSEAASAPDELIPLATGAIVSTHRYSSFIRDRWLSLYGLDIEARFDGDSDERLAIAFSPLEKREIAVGYILRHIQEWMNLGSHLGEVIHSLGLAPGESRNVAIVDWKRSLLARRGENTNVKEELNSLLVHTRALDEVTRAVAEEHQSGRTSTASATGVTAGSAVAAGSLIGSIGGAIVGGATGALGGLPFDAVTLGTDLGAVTISATVLGSFAGSAVGAVAGGAAAGLIFSGAGALGIIESDTKGDRTVGGDLGQNIMDVTAQKSSAIRSLRSTIVVEDNQSEQVFATKFNVTNYNHAHALTVQYYELLQRYRVTLTVDAVEPFLIVPFRPLDFKIDLVTDYWNIIRRGVPEAIRQPIDEMITETGLISIPKRPISENPEAALTFIQVELTFLASGVGEIPKFSVVNLGIGNRNDLKLNVIKTGIGAFVAQKFANSPIKINDIHGIRVRGTGIDLPTTMTLIIRQAQIRVGDDIVLLPAKSLGEYTLLNGSGDLDHVFVWDPRSVIREIEQADFSQFVKINRLMQYILERKYFFTQLLLAGIEAEQLSDILERLVIQSDDHNVAVPLADLIETIPIGFTSAGIVCRIRSNVDQARVYDVSKLMHLNRASNIPVGFAIPRFNDFKAFLLEEAKRKAYLKRIEEITSFGKDIFKWFEENQKLLTRTREINLPTSGLFAEAILGRSNAAEKIDLTRFINWQDMPIPNAAPAILSADTESRQESTPPLTVTNTDGVLNILPPTSFPDPTGLANALAAVQNGNIFRDMSQAAVLGSILNNLSGVAERTAIAAGQLSGDALAATLQSATQLASKVADGTQNLADSSLKSLTQLGGEANQTKSPIPPTPAPPTPTPSTPTPSTPAPSTPTPPTPTPAAPTPILRNVDILLRVFVQSEIWAQGKPTLLPSGIEFALQFLRFNGDNRSFSQDLQKTSRIDIPIKLIFDPATMTAVELDASRAFFGQAEIYLSSDTEHVPDQAAWFEKKKDGATPITGMVGQLEKDGNNIKIEKRSEGNNLVVSIDIAAKPQFPFGSSENGAFAEGISVPVKGIDVPLKRILGALIELVRIGGGGFDIDASFRITLSRRADNEIEYQVSGSHDGFPAYEMYVNGEAAYTFMPIIDDAPQKLSPPEEIRVAEQIPPEKQTRILRTI